MEGDIAARVVEQPLCWCNRPGVKHCFSCGKDLCLSHALLIDADKPDRYCSGCAYGPRRRMAGVATLTGAQDIPTAVCEESAGGEEE